MPTAGKVFVSTEYKPLADLAASLKGFREEGAYDEGEIQLELVTEVANVSINEGILTGL
jgi:hypothetical protein